MTTLNEKTYLTIQNWLISLNVPVESKAEHDKVYNLQNNQLQEFIKKENYMRTVLNSITDGIITIDRNCIIDSVNPSVEILFGYTKEELTGKDFSMLATECSRCKHDFLSETCPLAQRLLQDQELLARTKDNKEIIIEVGVSDIDLDNRGLYVFVVRDITKRREAEKIKDEFISVVNHELRTPLTAIKGSLDLVSGGALGEVPEFLNELLTIAKDNSVRLLNIVNDILDTEKITADKLKLNYSVFKISDLINEAVKLNESYAKQYEVQYVITETSDKLINSDYNRLLQVMANLLSNAAKFSPIGENIEIKSEVKNGKIRVSISDKGVGIPAIFRKSIFKKFYQVDSSDIRKRGGTGLGLSISKGLLEKMSGHIDFESEIGQGTTFYFEIPLYIDKT